MDLTSLLAAAFLCLIMKTGVTSLKISTEHTIYDGCSESNRCLGLPSKCVESSNCDVLLTHKNLPDGAILFNLHGLLQTSLYRYRRHYYMAMALSDDAVMGDDFVTACIRTGTNEGKLQHSWNVGKSNTRRTEAAIEYEFKVTDGIYTCTWIMENIISFNGRTFDLLNEKYHVLLAQGAVASGEIQYHMIRGSSSEPVDFHPNSEGTDTMHTNDSTNNQPRAKNNSSQLTLSWLLFGLSSCGYLICLLL